MEIKKKNQDGFTLVEMIVVIVILSVLLAILVPSLLRYVRKAKDTTAIEECSRVVKAANMELLQWYGNGEKVLSGQTLNPEKQGAVLEAAEANGKIEKLLVSDLWEVTDMRYQCADGTVVIFDADGDVRYRVEGEDEIMTAVETWVADAGRLYTEAYAAQGNTGYMNKDALVKDGTIKDSLLKVDDSLKRDTAFSQEELYWYPYNLGSAEKPLIILYANVKSDSSLHAWWKAKILYVNGKRYEGIANKDGSNIAAFKNYTTIEALEEYLDSEEGKKNFRLLD